MNISCLIIDDEPSSQNVLKLFINKIEYLKLIHICNDALEALDFLKNNDIDLLFLDINMPQLSGISFYKSLKNPPKVIFTTAYSEYALDGFEVDAIDYLLKPFSFDRFLKAVSKVKNLRNNSIQHIIIKSEKKLHQIKVNDIYYIEGLGDYIKVHLKDTFLITYKTLKKITDLLPKSNFVQVHKSYIINKNKLDYIEGNLAVINSKNIPLGQKYKSTFLNKLKE
ncbi:MULTISPECIES: LytR/AlgR family response regulator transcription factor [unclassified Tenacibaculum]|uniref:LytR/AlgR family response regulator transcription factor n=1 Tax=unclassified Tenacibaculum TaxID=2635139 RepID=UPI001F288B4E|nr:MULTISPECIES: LytTR family DNA-binding domain-containing protein [unclassified Tenacibaculum]MCF2874744.1 LytTR family DNA-binding domain-containing protein [Tenacibaculum sp. Cn5-1]MCF2934190.1 LytTR family DNA-binding domain-containing protein [Tenacibaculum sp. Cn5-34]MCG7510400.1 LytTR family DNA-binding domain-containing protein [Tenacibaculum sp. Cn5-46]